MEGREDGGEGGRLQLRHSEQIMVVTQDLFS